MNEVDFSGWTRSEDNLAWARVNWQYRWAIHWRRVWCALKQGRWQFFTWWNVLGVLGNGMDRL